MVEEALKQAKRKDDMLNCSEIDVFNTDENPNLKNQNQGTCLSMFFHNTYRT